MNRISKSTRFLLTVITILFSIPLIGGYMISQKIKKQQFALKENYTSSALKIPVPRHKKLLLESYKQELTFYAWWSENEDTLLAENLNDIIFNKYYFRQAHSSDTFSISYLPILKKFMMENGLQKEVQRRTGGFLSNQISILGRAPEEMIIRGGNIQIIPTENIPRVTYKVQEGSLCLGAALEYETHFKNLSNSYPNKPIGINSQPDFENRIVSPSTIFLGKNANLFIKAGYNPAKTLVTTASNSSVHVENQHAHSLITWLFADSTRIHCSNSQKMWFLKQFPDKILLFMPEENENGE